MTAQAAAMPSHDLDPVLGRLRAGGVPGPAAPLAVRRRLLLEVQAAVADHAAQWVGTAAGPRGTASELPR